MLSTILIAGVLVAVTVAVHVAGSTVLLKALRRWYAILPTRFWRITRLLVVVTWWLILLHLAEILLWGLFYLWWECLPDAEAAVYFSGVTYTTLGYGDVVLAGIHLRRDSWNMTAITQKCTACPSLAAAALEA
jgi:ion channel